MVSGQHFQTDALSLTPPVPVLLQIETPKTYHPVSPVFPLTKEVGAVISARTSASTGCRHSRKNDPLGSRGAIHVRPARSIFSKALNFCRSTMAPLVRSP
jgi:hypothetical protein